MCEAQKRVSAPLAQVLVKKREDADDVLGLSAAKRGAKGGKGKKGAAARVAEKANVRASVPACTTRGCAPPSCPTCSVNLCA